MLRSKKIMTEVFPKLGGLPQPVIDKMLEKANDGMLLYSPEHKIGEEKSGVYYCLRCGSHGEIIGDNIVCLKCCNHNVRSFQNDSYRSKFKGNCRYVHLVDEYVVMQDFYWCVEEKPEKGQYVNLSEMSRFIISDEGFILYDANFRYPYGGRDDREVTWTQRKKPSMDVKKHSICFTDKSILEHPIVSKVKEFLTGSTSEMHQALTYEFATNEEVSVQFPDVEFSEHDYSIIQEAGRWEVSSQFHAMPGTDDFEKQLCWCANCGEYHEEIVSTRYTRDAEKCPKCGYSRYNRQVLNIIIDGVETEDGDALLRIHGVHKTRDLDGDLVVGVNPKVKVNYCPEYTEFVLVTTEGGITFFNEDGKEMDRMKTPKAQYDKDQEVYFSEEVVELIKNSKAIKRTGFAEWMNSGATPRYFEYLKGMPCLEIFSKMGMYTLVHDILSKDLSDIPQYLRKTGKDSRLSKLSKPQINSLRKANASLKHLLAYMRVLNRDEEVLFEDFYDVASRSHERHVLDIMCVGIPGMTVAKIKDYMQRVDDAQCCVPSESMQLWSDYLRMLRDLEADLADTKLVYPNSLKREHDKAARKLEQVQNERLKERFEKKAEENEWLAYKGKTLSAVIPHQMTELYEEGRKLNHCVGTYAKCVADGSSIIAFVRKNNNTSEPYCTVEIRGKNIVQAKGFANRQGVLFPGVKEFLNEWSKEKKLTLDVA